MVSLKDMVLQVLSKDGVLPEDRASHGAEKHRTTGSIANTATQGRVFPGKKMPGHFGCDRITQKSHIVDVLPSQGAILIQGPVPGAKNSLIEIRKQKGLQ